MKEIISGIYQLEMPLPNNPLGHVNIYLVRAGEECLLVDTGWDTEESLGSLRGQLAELGLSLESISRIVGTHIHPDHYGLAGKLRQLSKSPIFLHYLEVDLIKAYSDLPGLVKQGVEWMYVNGVPDEQLKEGLARLQTTRPEMIGFSAPTLPDTTLRGDEVISIGSFGFKVMWTPGHSPGHICLYEPTQEILLSADHIMPHVTTDVSLDPNSRPNPLGDYLNSMKELREFKVSLVLPGHGQPFSDLAGRIEEIIQYQDQRNAEILEKARAEAKTGSQISSELTWIRNGKVISSLDLHPWDRRLALLKTLAHLELMKSEGLVAKSVKDNVIYYQAA